MLRHNKFLHKVAFDGIQNDIAAANPVVAAENRKALMDLLNGVVAPASTASPATPTIINAIRHGIQGIGDTARTAAIMGNVQSAYNRLNRYNQGLMGTNQLDPQDYDPHADITEINRFINNPNFRANWDAQRGAWANAPKGSMQARLYPQIENALGYSDALNYAANNKDAFKKFNSFRGMGIWDYLFDSADNNYKLLQMANGPMGKFMSPEQAKRIRNNYGLMKGIWRFKKFFADFGNWKHVDDPEVAARKMRSTYNIPKPYWTPSTNTNTAPIEQAGTPVKQSVKK